MGSEMDLFAQEFADAFGMGLFSFMISYVPSMLMSLAVYIVTALSLYTIAKRRGIHNPWLAWVPIANMWMLGCISDHYRSVARREVKNRRKSLLGLYIAAEVLAIAVLALVFSALFEMLSIGFEALETMPDDMVLSLIGPFVGSLLLCIPMLIVAIVYMVIYYIALHDVFKSCDPGNATLYLVLSIFVSITLPIFLFICRNKDDGMPAPAQPMYEIPQWQPAQPPVEPWQQNQE